jgi:signal transduction histidine kinase
MQRDFCAALMAMAGHDLRQPLQVITTAHDLLAAAFTSGQGQAHLARAEAATSRLSMMLTQIVDALQLHEIAWDFRNQPVPLGPVLEELAGEFSSKARAKDICLRVVPPRVTALSHPTLLAAILRNLVRNALDYTPAGGRVLVACRRRGSRVNIEVRDNGIGIRSDELRKIFDAFHRSEAAHTDGLGLGLFIVQRAAKFLGHPVEVRSAIGHGSCFTLIATAARQRNGGFRAASAHESNKELVS